MIAVYLRISTEDQKTDGQRRDVTRWLKGHGHNLKRVRWYVDQESGDTLDRSAFKEMQKAIFDGEMRTVVVWKLDRLSRTLLDGMNLVAGWCKQGVRIVSVTQQIDLSGTMGQIIASVLFGFAQIELESIRERRAAGIAAAKERGVYKGRAAGTTKAKPARAVQLRKKGLKVGEIATALGVSQRTAERYLATA
jgi:DNA invertase Pin-like site-specific DNA recombinase